MESKTKQTNKQSTPNSQKKKSDLWLPEEGDEEGEIRGRWSKGANFQLQGK